MSQPLPTGRFKWVDVEPEEVKELSVREDRGYLIGVDVLYPKELHDKHNDLPFMCVRMKIGGVDKLVADLYCKKRYVIHIRALQQALNHGLVLERIHRTIELKRSQWMKEYIAFNTKLRTAAKDDFEKDFYKLMNDAVFGKTMENIRYIDNDFFLLVKELSVREDRGYLIGVDVLYPKELHDKHNDLPFMCGRMKIGGVDKLVADLYCKKRYVIHIRALQQALNHGLVLERIHRTIELKRSQWMKEYIAFNTKLRTAAKDDFEKDFYKLMNDAVFGKTMENIRYIDNDFFLSRLYTWLQNKNYQIRRLSPRFYLF